jgi:MFS family permease
MKTKFPKQVIIVGLVSLFTDIASEMLYPVTPVFLTTVLGSSMALVGAIEGLAEITAALLKGYFGRLSDRVGKRSPFIIIGYFLSAMSKPLPGIFANIPAVIFSRVTDRVGKGIRTAPRDALLASYADKNNTGAVFGFHRGMDTLGAAIGPVLALLLLSAYNDNYTLVFIAAFVPSVIAVIFTFVVKDKEIKNPVKKASFSLFWQSAPAAYKNIFYLVVLFSFVNSSDVFLILKSRDVTGSTTLAITGYIIYNIIYAASSYPLGIWSDKIGKKKIFVSGLLIFSVVYAGFAFANQLTYLWILFGMYGIYAASTEGVVKAWISDLVPDQQRGSAIGLLTMFSGFAVMAGSIFTGFLWDNFGAAVPLAISAIISFVLAIIILLRKTV